MSQPVDNIFLGPLRSADLRSIQQRSAPKETKEEYTFTASGTAALRLLIREQKLAPGSLVAIPPLICSAVTWAIRAEKMEPAFVDIDPETFFMKFDADELKKQNIAIIVLPHLYGILHPQTKEFMEYADENNIPLIHDAAQSWKLLFQGEDIITYNAGGFYSFGAGKALTAAGGAIVSGIGNQAIQDLKLRKLRPIDLFSQNFLKERMGLPASKYRSKLFPWHRRKFRASRIEVNGANYLLERMEAVEKRRKENWLALGERMPQELYSKGYHRTSFYKYICTGEEAAIRERAEGVPVRIVPKTNRATKHTPAYNAMAENIFEISTERSLEEFTKGNIL